MNWATAFRGGEVGVRPIGRENGSLLERLEIRILLEFRQVGLTGSGGPPKAGFITGSAFSQSTTSPK